MAFRGTTALSSIGKLYKIFNHRQKKAFGWLLFLTFFGSLTDLIGLFSIIPVIGIVLSEHFYNTVVHNYPIIALLTKTELLLWSLAFFLVLIVSKNVFGLYINRLQVRFVQNLFVSSTLNVLNKVYNRTMLDIQKDTSNELVNKLTNLQISLGSNAAISTLIIINEGIVFLLTAILVCFWNWQLFLLLICVLFPTMGYFYNRIKDMIKTAGIEKSNNSIQLYASAQEMIFGYTDIKIAGTENNFKKRFENIARTFSKYQGRLDFMLFIPTRILEIAAFLCVIAILLFGVFVIKDTEKIVATLVVFSLIAGRSLPSINRFVIAINNLNSTEFIFQDPDFYPEEVMHGQQNTPPISFHNKITFDNLSYKYSGLSKYVIQNCNIEIKKGEKIGFVGKSGSGKSTLINNILGFLEPTKGRILIDGVELNKNNVKEWWKIIGYVRQEVFIMNASLLENIAIGVPADAIDINRINKAIKLSSLTELVNDLPDGVNTVLSERGNNLSGGQKQRIAIARAIYKGAQVLIFDEATSALDSKTEEEITNSIRELGDEHLTIIIIAHRITSLKYCNTIYQLENGNITHALSYSELLKETKTSNS
jgi:ABC-type multidrug transport system fused ATPase/permease subunit